MANRSVYTSASPPPVTGPQMLDNHAEKIGIMFNAIALIPTSVTNSGNDYTIVVDPTLNADVVAGMMFYIQPNVDGSGAVRVRVTSSNPYHDVVKSNADPLTSGDWQASTVYGCLFIGGQFRILTQQAQAAAAEETSVTEYLTSTTWTKPTGLNPEAVIDVEMWAGGGGGGSTQGGGGGGGAYIRKQFKASDLTASVSLTIGAGGATASAGGNTTFGSYLTVYGGGGGANTASGGGGGQKSAGTSAVTTTPGVGGGLGGGAAATSASQPGGGSGGGGGAVLAYFGGGGGGTSAAGAGAGTKGGDSMYGGAGGGGGVNGAGTFGAVGVSTFGGNGGSGGNNSAAATSGSVPGGGGGGGGGSNPTGAVGGAGKIIIRIIP